MIQKTFLQEKFLLFFAFLIPLIYWIYLLFSSQMVIQYDSLDYEQLGRILKQDGWLEYFKTGPNREPIYPLLISWAMRIAYAFCCARRIVAACCIRAARVCIGTRRQPSKD